MNHRDLALAAAKLSYRAPHEFAEFVSALAAWTDAKRDECINSNPETLPTAQGRAQACVELRKIIAECRETADRVANKPQKPSQPQHAAGSALWRP